MDLTFRRASSAMFILPLLLLNSTASLAQDQEGPDPIARRAAMRFETQMSAGTADKILKSVDIPFVLEGPTSQVLRKQEELDKLVQDVISRRKQAQVPDRMIVVNVREFSKASQGWSKERKAVFDGVLEANDRVVTLARKSGDLIDVYVRIRKNQGRVVGSGGAYRPGKSG